MSGGITATYIGANEFSVSGDDYRTNFTPGRHLKMNCEGDGYKLGWVYKPTISGSVTFVTTHSDSAAITSNLSEVFFAHTDISRDYRFSENFMLSGRETLISGSTYIDISFGQTVSGTSYPFSAFITRTTTGSPWLGSLTATNPTTSGIRVWFSGIIDDATYELSWFCVSYVPNLDNYATQIYVDDAIATVSGGSGVTDHGELTGLLDDDHTQYLLRTDFTTYSGAIVDQIPTDFYTQAEITTISGDIIAQIPSLTGYATESYVDSADATLSGVLVAQIPSLSGYATEAYVTTVSGNIVAQIPSLAGYATESYVDTASGTLQTQIDAKGDMNDLVDDTTPQLGGDLDINDKLIMLDPTLASDTTGDGFGATVTVDTNATGFGAALRMGSDGHYDEADASATSTMPCTALALETGTGSKKVLLIGYIRKDAWNWTVGGIMYVSETTGALTQTPPATAGACVQPVGIAKDADTILFNPTYHYVEVAA